ncbi:MAG: hypothetical protein HYY26_06220 [Acidobacteria bacterium]|nr:hypothetical protein [Acidobacteriota bacterium]
MADEPQAASTATAEPAVPAQGITVELSYATVAAFEHAVAVARKHPSFQEFGEGKNRRVRVTYQMTELEALQELKEAAWELHHKRAWLEGNEIAWHEMAEMTFCFREYLQRPRRDHCFFDGNFWSGWGCKYAVANFSDRINTEWLTLGHLDSDGAWVFDKARVAAYVKEKLFRGYQHCPAFDVEYLELLLEVFPERIDPVEDNRWRHVRNRRGEILYVGPKDVDAAKKIVYELQEKVRQRRGADSVQPNGKRKLAADWFRRYQPAARKRSLWVKIFG